MHYWMPAARYPFSSLLIALMLATIAAIFVFARPEYHAARFPGRCGELYSATFDSRRLRL